MVYRPLRPAGKILYYVVDRAKICWNRSTIYSGHLLALDITPAVVAKICESQGPYVVSRRREFYTIYDAESEEYVKTSSRGAVKSRVFGRSWPPSRTRDAE